MEVEIGRGKKGRRAYGFDDIAIVPSRRTRDAEDVDITWKLGPHTLPLQCLASKGAAGGISRSRPPRPRRRARLCVASRRSRW